MVRGDTRGDGDKVGWGALTHGAHLAGGDTPRGCCSRRRTGGTWGQLCQHPRPPRCLPKQCHPRGLTLKQSRGCTSTLSSVYTCGDRGSVTDCPQPALGSCGCPHHGTQGRAPSPAPPRWPWSWGRRGRAQPRLSPPSSTGWPWGAGGSWRSAPSPSGPCCRCCSRGSAPRTTARGRLRAQSQGGGRQGGLGVPFFGAGVPSGTHKRPAAPGRGSACCAGCHAAGRRPGEGSRAVRGCRVPATRVPSLHGHAESPQLPTGQ